MFVCLKAVFRNHSTTFTGLGSEKIVKINKYGAN